MNTTPAVNCRRLLDRATGAARAAAHLAHETRSLKVAASDAIADSAYTARRTMTRAQRGVESLRDDAAYRIRHNPFAAVSAGFAAGVGLGAVVAVATLWRPRGHESGR